MLDGDDDDDDDDANDDDDEDEGEAPVACPAAVAAITFNAPHVGVNIELVDNILGRTDSWNAISRVKRLVHSDLQSRVCLCSSMMILVVVVVVVVVVAEKSEEVEELLVLVLVLSNWKSCCFPNISIPINAPKTPLANARPTAALAWDMAVIRFDASFSATTAAAATDEDATPLKSLPADDEVDDKRFAPPSPLPLPAAGDDAAARAMVILLLLMNMPASSSSSSSSSVS